MSVTCGTLECDACGGVVGNLALHDAIPNGCPVCGGVIFTKNGFSYTGISKFQRYRCSTCGAPVRGKKALSTAEYRQVA